jgi:hypothetical protein
MIDAEQRLSSALNDPALGPPPPADPMSWVRVRVKRDRRRRAGVGLLATALVAASGFAVAAVADLHGADERLRMATAPDPADAWRPPPAERAVVSSARLETSPMDMDAGSMAATVDVVLEGDAGRAGATGMAIYRQGDRYCLSFLDTSEMATGCGPAEPPGTSTHRFLTGQTTSGAGYTEPEAFAWGWAPAGTAHVTLKAPDDRAVTLPAYPAANGKFDGRAFFFGRYDVMRQIEVTYYDVERERIGGDDVRPETSQAASREASQDEAEQIVRELRRFAQEPSASRAEQLPFASRVQLGLGGRLLKTVGSSALADPSAWSVPVPTTPDYAWIGDRSLSALKLLASDGEHTTSVGPHPHCASPPRPAPPGMVDHDRISTQPAAGGCLSWYSVDVFLRDGEIQAVTLDLWEP